MLRRSDSKTLASAPTANASVPLLEVRTSLDRGVSQRPVRARPGPSGGCAIAHAKISGLRLCLGSDWAPSGTTNVLWELKVADLWNQANHSRCSPQELCELVTANPGDALAQVWPHPVGRLVPGAAAYLVVVANRNPDVYANLIGATERDIRLVVVGGAARYGIPALLCRGWITWFSSLGGVEQAAGGRPAGQGAVAPHHGPPQDQMRDPLSRASQSAAPCTQPTAGRR
jgi:imidazolonepropionase-like amidohydrolase